MNEMLDARGLICPMPVLKARKKLVLLPDGARLTVLSDDPKAANEFTMFCAEMEWQLVSVATNGNVTEVIICK